VSFTFVYRSFYSMRIGTLESAQAPAVENEGTMAHR